MMPNEQNYPHLKDIGCYLYKHDVPPSERYPDWWYDFEDCQSYDCKKCLNLIAYMEGERESAGGAHKGGVGCRRFKPKQVKERDDQSDNE